MTVREFYDAIGGNYDDAIGRMMSESLVRRFVLKFKADPTFDQLKEAIGTGDPAAAFPHAHTFKGVSLNLSFAKLSEAAIALTDALREQNRASYSAQKVKELFAAVEREYNRVIEAIGALE